MPKTDSTLKLPRAKNQPINLTQKNVNSAHPRLEEYFLRDSKLKGFNLRIKPTGAKSYGVSSRLQGTGKPIQRIIGSTHRYTAADARGIAKQWLQDINAGLDPKQKPKKIPTPKELLEIYLTHKDLRPNTVSSYRLHFDKTLAKLAHKPCNEITSDELVNWYTSDQRNKRQISTERAFSTLKTVLGFAKTIKLIDSNPADIAAKLINRPKEGKKKALRMLSVVDDVKPFMNAFLEYPISETIRDWIVLVLTTGMRKTESMSLTWDQVDLDKKLVTISDNKAQRVLFIPMTGLTYSMFKHRAAKPNADPVYVFQSRAGGHIKDTRKTIQKICEHANCFSYTPHDFRRIFGSVCSELDISEQEIGKLLNHSTKSVTDLYIQKQFDSVRRKYDKVTDFLDRLVILGEAKEEEPQVISGTSVMRAIFYGAEMMPDAPVTLLHVQEEQMREERYWDGF